MVTQEKLTQMTDEELRNYAETFGIFDSDREELIRRTCFAARILYVRPGEKRDEAFPYLLGLIETADKEKNARYTIDTVGKLVQDGIDQAQMDLQTSALFVAMGLNVSLTRDIEQLSNGEMPIFQSILGVRMGLEKMGELLSTVVNDLSGINSVIDHTELLYRELNIDTWDTFARASAEYFALKQIKMTKFDNKGGVI